MVSRAQNAIDLKLIRSAYRRDINSASRRRQPRTCPAFRNTIEQWYCLELIQYSLTTANMTDVKSIQSDNPTICVLTPDVGG
jgi:hypothetical protein